MPPAADSVLVIGALHHLHEREPSFRYEELKEAIVAFAPDILVLEVRPDELAQRTVTPGRPEYPAVIWPLLSDRRIEAVAMEPGGESFKTITGEASTAFQTFRQRNANGAAALAQLDKATEELLLEHWQSPAHVQDETTASLSESMRAAQFALVGPAFAAAQLRWDAYMTGRALEAIRQNAGKRIMVIGSYRNRALLESALRTEAPGRVIGSSVWFDDLD
jgi:hypothetical protein